MNFNIIDESHTKLKNILLYSLDFVLSNKYFKVTIICLEPNLFDENVKI